MREKLKNLSFPVKCGLAILTFPLGSMIIAYLLLYGLGMARPEGGWEMEPLLPIMLLYIVSFPLFLLSLPLPSLKYFFYKYFISILPPLSLIPWFILGYLIGKLVSRFNPKIQKFILFFFIVAPIALFVLPLLMMVPLVLLGVLLNNFWLFVLVVMLGVWLMVRWVRRRK